MIELYVFVLMSSVGYILAKKKNYSHTKKNFYKNEYTIPQISNPVHNTYIPKTQKIQRNLLKNRHAESNTNDNIIKNEDVVSKKDVLNATNVYESRLSGEILDKTNFVHNNMVPFFGGSVKQNIDLDKKNTLLEMYTGVDDDVKIEKKDNICFADQHVNTTDNSDLEYLTELDRMVTSNTYNNINPTKQIKVGKGINLNHKFGSKPSGGFQQYEYSDLVAKTYKNIDELRVKTNQKDTYEGRVIDGQKSSLPGKQSKLNKNKVDRFYEKTEANLFKTTGANLKDAKRPCTVINDNNRKTTTTSYKGIPFQNTNGKLKSAFEKYKKNTLQSYGDRNVSTLNEGLGNKDDYGRKNVMVYTNERDITSVNTYQGNITSIVKSFITPIQQVLDPTTKEYTIVNNRQTGNMQMTGPSKQTSYDPNDTAKTTIKETLIHDQKSGNIKSYEKQTIYDPNDIARTTIKETTIDDGVVSNLKGRVKNIVYDPSDITKTTLRQVLNTYDYNMNIHGMNKQTIYDPNDVSKTTMRETTENSHRDGNINTTQKNDGYINVKYKADITNKQIMSDNQHIGNANIENSDGYKTTEYKADITNKQITSDNDYYGGLNNSDTAFKSYDNVYNAIMNDTKELLYDNRIPTTTSTKVTSGKENISLSTMKNTTLQNNQLNLTSINNEIPSKMFLNNTKIPEVCNESRLDSTLVAAFLENPYTQSLTSAV